MLESDVITFNIKNTDDTISREIIYDFNLYYFHDLYKINTIIQKIVDNHNKALIKNKNGELLVITTSNDDKNICIYGSLNIYNNYVNIEIRPYIEYTNMIISIKTNKNNLDIRKKTKFHKHIISNSNKDNIIIEEKYKNLMNEMLLFICDLFVSRVIEQAMLIYENNKLQVIS